EPAHPSKRVPSTPAVVQKLTAEQNFQADLAASTDPGPDHLAAVEEAPAPSSESRQKPAGRPAPRLSRSTIKAHLDRPEAALEAGALAGADVEKRKLEPHRERFDKELLPRWKQAGRRFRELQEWEQWSNRRQRRQL